MRERPLEIDEVFFGETNGPATGVGEFVASPIHSEPIPAR